MAVGTRGYILNLSNTSVQELMPKPDDNDDFDGVLEVIVRANQSNVFIGGPDLTPGSTYGFELVANKEYRFNVIHKSQIFLTTPEVLGASVYVFRTAEL